MKIALTPSYVLTDEHSASSYGIPVLVHRQTEEAFGPADIVACYPSWGFMPAKEAVERLSRMTKLTYDEQQAVDRFCGK